MDLDLTLRIINVISDIVLAKAELDSDDDMYDIIDIILNSILTAYHRHKLYELEEILNKAETIISTMEQ